MLYKYLNSKKGFTLTELLAVVLILGVLLAIAVPIFDTGLRKQKEKDCQNQRLVMETAVKQAMYGMIDNGARQPEITFKCTVVGADGIGASIAAPHTSDDPTDNEKRCFIFTDDPETCFTFAELRGGYRVGTYDEFKTQTAEDYKEGCNNGQYLKKLKYQYNAEDSSFKGVPFYDFLDNSEVPVCPFAPEENPHKYYYYVVSDGTVHCTCELDDDK